MRKKPHRADQTRPTVLFVDDELLSQKYFKASIGEFANVLTAKDPLEARKILEVRGSEISVVVSDERMPFQCGVPFLVEVKNEWPAVVRILTTAFANVDKLQEAINLASIHGFVPKPWNLEQLSQAVRDGLAAPAKDSQPEDFASDDGIDQQRADRISLIAQCLVPALQKLGTDARHLVALAGQNPQITNVPAETSQLNNWSSQFKLAQISTVGSHLEQDAVACVTAAEAIVALVVEPRTFQ